MKCLVKLLFVAVLAVFAGSATAATVNLNWEFDATTCADGSPVVNCPATGFEIQKQDGVQWVVLGGVGKDVRTKQYVDVSPGEHCYRVRTNSSGTFSDPSNVACITVPNSKPNSVTITVTIQVTENGVAVNVE